MSTPVLSLDLTALLTMAFAIVTGFTGLIALVGGLRLGFKLVRYLIEVIAGVL